LKILEESDQLVGKTIAFAHIAQFAKAITLATTDKEVMVIEQGLHDEDDDMFRSEISIYHKYRAMEYIEGHKYLREELAKKGIFDLDEYRQKEQEKRERERVEFRKQKEAKERKEYERLKHKFEEDNSNK